MQQILDRGYSVTDVSKRLGVSTHSLYKWVKLPKRSPGKRRVEEFLEAKRALGYQMPRQLAVWGVQNQGVIKTFFNSLSKKKVRKRIYRTRNKARAEIFDYIEGFYD